MADLEVKPSLDLSLKQARKLARRFGLHDARELDAVAWEAHEKAIVDFDASRTTCDPRRALAKFVMLRVRYAVLDELVGMGKLNHIRRRDDPTRAQLTKYIEDIELDVSDPSEFDEHALDRALAVRSLETLKPREQVILRLWSEGRTLSSIGAELGFSRERARQLMNEGMDHLRRGFRTKRLTGSL